MKKIMFISLGLAFFFNMNAQVLDTNNLFFNAKLYSLDFNNDNIDKDDALNIIKALSDTIYFKARVLKSKGFSNVIFIEVEFDDLNFPNNIFNKQEESNIKETFTEKFILAYSLKSHRFYKVKNFVNNEFNIFYNDYLLMANSVEQELFKNKIKFINNYAVESIDLGCLYESLFSRKKISYEKYPCLEPSYSRMIEINGLPIYY